MPVYDNTSLHEMNELLQQMKELHAPDRCEGIGNDVWHGFAKLAAMGKETSQQKIEKKWNDSKNLEARKTLMKATTSGSGARGDLWGICKEVDSSRIPTMDQAQLNAFIGGCTESQLQKMFDIMIVQMTWRDRLIRCWGIDATK